MDISGFLETKTGKELQTKIKNKGLRLVHEHKPMGRRIQIRDHCFDEMAESWPMHILSLIDTRNNTMLAYLGYNIHRIRHGRLVMIEYMCTHNDHRKEGLNRILRDILVGAARFGGVLGLIADSINDDSGLALAKQGFVKVDSEDYLDAIIGRVDPNVALRIEALYKTCYCANERTRKAGTAAMARAMWKAHKEVGDAWTDPDHVLPYFNAHLLLRKS
jgi:hypothetical protein